MGGELLYLDSSALVKLVLPEAESAALLESLAAWPVRVASELATVEVLRAVRRATADPALEQRAEEVLAGVHLLRIDTDILSRAARLEPRTLRSLDAVHLASALSLGEDLGAIVIYDGAFAAAAAASGLQVLAPAPGNVKTETMEPGAENP
jgi:predicted nucleic acid-binding protein